MKKNFFFVMAIGMMAVACNVEDLKLEDAGAVSSYGGPQDVRKIVPPTPGDTLTAYDYADARIDLADEETFTFRHLEVWEQAGIVEKDEVSCDRPFGAEGESVDTLYTNNLTAKTVKLGSISEMTEWQNGLWKGTQEVMTDRFAFVSGADSVKFTTRRYASEACYEGEHYSVVFPFLNWEVSEEMKVSNEYMTSVNGKTYKAADAVSLVTYTASVPAEYGKDSKTFELTNKLVMLALQANMTTKVENKAYTAEFQANGAELSTISQKNSWDEVVYDYDEEISRDNKSRDLDLKATLSGTNAIVKVESAEALGQVKVTSVSAGANQVKTVKDGDITKKTYTQPYKVQLSDGNVMNVVANWEVETSSERELGYAEITNVTAKGLDVEALGDNKIKVTPRFNVVVKVNDITATKAGNSHNETYEVSDSYVQAYEPKDELVSTREEGIITPKADGTGAEVKANFYETWSLSGEKLVNTQKGEMNFTLAAEKANDIYAANKNFTTTSNGMANGKYTSTVSNGSVSDKNIYNYTFDSKKTFEYNGRKVEFIGTMDINEVETTIGDSSTKTLNGKKYTAYPYKNVVRGGYNITTENAEKVRLLKKAFVTRNILVAETLVSRRAEGVVKANGNGFDVTANFYETWSLSGEKLVNTQKGKMNFTLTAESASDIYAANTSFATTSNGMANGKYTSTVSNGTVSAKNVYNYTFDSKKIFEYDGQKVEFIGNMNIVEVSSTIGSASIVVENGTAYDAYPYKNTVKGTYTVNSQNAEKTASVSRNILVARPVEKLIPDAWGKVKAVAISAVPAHAIGGDKFAYGEGQQSAHKCLAIQTDKGYIPVVFVFDKLMPTKAQIQSANFTSGQYAGFNSGVDPNKNGNWIPAKAQDENNRLTWVIDNDGHGLEISNEVLSWWNWRDGNLTTVVDGYTFNVSGDGVVTVYYNGNFVIQFK